MLVMLAGNFLSEPEFWVAVAFFGFVGLILYYQVPGMLAKVLDERADGIRRELDEARKLREDAQALLADYQTRARKAEDEAKSIVEQAKLDAAQFASDSRKALQETLERRTRLAEEKITRAEAQALGEVRAAAVDAAVGAAERILRNKISTEVDAGLIAQGVSELRGKLN
jgi:F-type H+-transporting ATPase subunit b